MPLIWKDLAKEFNKDEDQEVAIAEVNCVHEIELCSGIKNFVFTIS